LEGSGEGTAANRQQQVNVYGDQAIDKSAKQELHEQGQQQTDSSRSTSMRSKRSIVKSTKPELQEQVQQQAEAAGKQEQQQKYIPGSSLPSHLDQSSCPAFG